jgi:folate-binding protein YgfZ
MALTGPGAVAVADLDPSDVDSGLVAHYGDPLREQRTLTTAAGLVDRGNRGVITVTGPDRLSWLHSLTTQHVARLAPLSGTELLVLSPHGHVEHHAMALDDGETTWLDVEPGAAPALLEFLTKMRFLTRVELADVTAGWAVVSLVGPDSPGALATLGVDVPAPAQVAPVPGAKFASGAVAAASTSSYPAVRLPSPAAGFARRMPYGVDLLVPRDGVAELAGRLGVPLAGVWAFEAVRVADRRPRLGRETDHRTLPAEVGWLAAAVHLEKGCYRGQETVARVHNLGKPPRRLVLLHLDGVTSDQVPAHGAEVTGPDGRTVGFVGTAVRHFELGMVALAVLKRAVPDDARLLVGACAALVDPDPEGITAGR